MPGFNSFLFGRGPFTSHRPDTPPQPDSDSEPEAVRKAMRRVRRHVTTVYGVTMRRNDVEATHIALKQLRADIKDQTERFHDAGLAHSKERKVLLEAFAEKNQELLRDAGAILQRQKFVEGPIEELETGLRELGALTGRDEMMDLGHAERVMGVYRLGLRKPLDEMVSVLRSTLEAGVWRRG